MPAKSMTLGPPGTHKVAVISHERSGTHFLMNTIALNFGYINRPWWNFDFEIGLNMHSSRNIRRYLQQADGQPLLNIFKSHHSFGFFTDIVDSFTTEFRVLYIYRDPRDVMASNWKLIQSFDWDEGPCTDDISTFLRAAPRGGMMRYQKIQEPTMLHRWKTHVEGWLECMESRGNDSILTLRYEDLNLAFETTLESIAGFLGKSVTSPQRPHKDTRVIGSGPGQVHNWKTVFNPGDNEYVLSQIGETMRRCGYE